MQYQYNRVTLYKHQLNVEEKSYLLLLYSFSLGYQAGAELRLLTNRVRNFQLLVFSTLIYVAVQIQKYPLAVLTNQLLSMHAADQRNAYSVGNYFRIQTRPFHFPFPI